MAQVSRLQIVGDLRHDAQFKKSPVDLRNRRSGFQSGHQRPPCVADEGEIERVAASNGRLCRATVLIRKYERDRVDHAAILRRGAKRQILQQGQQRLSGMAETLGQKTEVVSGCQSDAFFTAPQ